MGHDVDCLIVGGGPAGLTAAIYAARFRLAVRVVDAGESRAALIPITRNHAGFPDGIAGRELIARMRRHAAIAGAQFRHGAVTALTKSDGGFEAETTRGAMTARAVLLATGVTTLTPPMDDHLRRAAMEAGRLRYCPVCDGHEVIDQAVAVIGTGKRALEEAIFLRAYTARVSLIAPQGRHDPTPAQRREAETAGIETLDGPVSDFQLDRFGLSFSRGAAGRARFEAVYPSMGSMIHSDLARALGARLTEAGCVEVDAHQRTSVPGLYAAGDVVIGLDQISHAMGEAGVAATAIRNDLAQRRPMSA